MKQHQQAKVAHITTVDSSLRYLLLNQITYLQQTGYDVVGISTPGPNVPILEAAHVRHIPLAMSRNIAPLDDLRSLMRLVRILRREHCTIVHTHNPKPGLLGQLAAKLARVPVIVNTLHGFYFHAAMPAHKQRFYIMLEKVAARCSDIILSQSQEDIQTALRERICRPQQIRHLGNGIDLSRFDPAHIEPAARDMRRASLGIPADAPVIGFVGRLAARRKGFLDFLAAGQHIVQQFPQAHFLIIGASDVGKPDAVHPDEAHEYGIAHHCHFVGERPNEELPGFYASMDVLVLPSLFEGVPRALMEGAAMGVPLVATDVKGNREVVAHQQNGLLVPLGDVHALTVAIVQVLNDQAMARQMGAAGQRMAREHFNERCVFEKVKWEYARILREKGFSVPSSSVTGVFLG
jgi:glycosyltransferase involved in cell wall biosynthesis